MKKIIGLFIFVFFLGFGLYCNGGMDSSVSKISEPVISPPMPQGNSIYSFDENATKALINQKSSIMKIKCDGLKVLQSMGFTDRLAKLFSIGVENGDFDFNFDIRNCSMRGNKKIYNYDYKSLTEAKAFEYAENFMKNPYFKGKIFDKLDKPVLLYKNSNSGPYPIMKDSAENDNYFDGIDIDPNDTGEIEMEYTDFTIMYPYLINGKKVYNQYGGLAGVTLNINSNGVNSINAQLLPFIGAIRKSEKLTDTQLVDFVKVGGNNSYRGPSQNNKIVLEKPQRVLVLFTLWKNNISEMFLSTGIRFGSKVKTDPYAQSYYEIIISDYKIGNTATVY